VLWRCYPRTLAQVAMRRNGVGAECAATRADRKRGSPLTETPFCLQAKT
jgi:hypothetical protein